MLNQATVEALYSATYIENYLEFVENLPDELQRYISRVRELDLTFHGEFNAWLMFARLGSAIELLLGHECTRLLQFLLLVGFLKEVEQQCDAFLLEVESAAKRNNHIGRVQQALIYAQELGDEKLRILQQVQDIIENKTRQLDTDYKNLGALIAMTFSLSWKLIN